MQRTGKPPAQGSTQADGLPRRFPGALPPGPASAGGRSRGPLLQREALR
jgi:hypothetical protein